MTVIKANFGEGGANLVPKGTTTSPSLAETMRDVADDLAAGKAAEVTSPDGVAAAGAAPDKAEFDAVVLLVNELKTKLNAVEATTIKTVKG